MPTVFTADVVEYNFLPEKYASKQDLVVAELNILCEVDWQESINRVYSDDSADIDEDDKIRLTKSQDT